MGLRKTRKRTPHLKKKKKQKKKNNKQNFISELRRVKSFVIFWCVQFSSAWITWPTQFNAQGPTQTVKIHLMILDLSVFSYSSCQPSESSLLSHSPGCQSSSSCNTARRCPWCNGYRRWKWTRRHEFKSWTRLIAFHIALIALGKVWIQLYSLQLWVNSRTDWVLQPWWDN